MCQQNAVYILLGNSPASEFYVQHREGGRGGTSLYGKGL